MCQRLQGFDRGSLEAPGYNPQAFILDLLQLPRGCCAASLVRVWLMPGVGGMRDGDVSP